MSWEIIGGLGSFAGSIINGISQATTNQTNQEIANRTNRSNERINESQLAAQRENWKREQENFMLQRQWQLQDREYNTPEAMKQRYLNAGINPYLAMYGGSGMQGAASENSPNAPSFSSPASPIPMQTGAPMQPIDMSGLGIAGQNFVNTKLASERQEADLAALRQQLDLQTMESISRMHKAGVDNAYTEALTNKTLTDLLFDKDSWNHRLQNIENNNNLIQANINKIQEDQKYQHLLNQFEPVRQKLIRREFNAKYNEIMSQVNANNASAAYSIALKCLTDAQKAGLDIDNSVKEEIAGSLVSKAIAEADLAEFNAQRQGRFFEEGEVVGRALPNWYDYKTGQKANWRPTSRRIMKRDKNGKPYFVYMKYSDKHHGDYPLYDKYGGIR